MKISLLTREFSLYKRLIKNIERKSNYFKYKAAGNKHKAWSCTFSEGGHPDVVDSFLKGAVYFPETKIYVNPSRSQARGTVVYVPSGWRALRDAIVLRRRGEIKRIIAGPTVCDLPYQNGFIVADPAIDVCLVASDWMHKVFIANLAGVSSAANIKVCPCGVDHYYWCPTREASADFHRALIYIKHSGSYKLPEIRGILRDLNKSAKILFYGEYLPEEYRQKLDWCDFVVVAGESETQGVAISQAWSMNKQTLVYDSHIVSKYHRDGGAIAEKFASPAPLLSENTGTLWKTGDELMYLIKNMKTRAPREWVLKNQTNKIAFANLLAIIKNIR